MTGVLGFMSAGRWVEGEVIVTVLLEVFFVFSAQGGPLQLIWGGPKECLSRETLQLAEGHLDLRFDLSEFGVKESCKRAAACGRSKTFEFEN